MTAAVVVLLRLQPGVEPDPTDNTVQRIAADTADTVAVVLDDRIVAASLAPRPPQQPAQSVELGTRRLGEPETRGYGGPEVHRRGLVHRHI